MKHRIPGHDPEIPIFLLSKAAQTAFILSHFQKPDI